MTRKQHLNEILWIEKCTLRTKKSKYFTEEFFELCKIKKYKELLLFSRFLEYFTRRGKGSCDR